MRVTSTADAASFAAAARAWLATEPFTANVLATLLDGVLSGTRTTMPDPAWLTVRDVTGVVVGAAMHTHPVGVFLPRLPEPAAAAVADAVHAAGRRPAGVTGEAGAAGAFAERWVRLTGTVAVTRHATRLFRLGRLARPTGVDGSVRSATAADTGLVTDWTLAFAAEAGAAAESTPEVVADTARRRVAAGQTLLWEVAGTPVSTASWSPPAAGVARIGPVFTPPGRRRHGFAAAVTAAAADRARAAGAAEVVLYTDLANATSNGVYRRIGFVPVSDGVEVAFAPARR